MKTYSKPTLVKREVLSQITAYGCGMSYVSEKACIE